MNADFIKFLVDIVDECCANLNPSNVFYPSKLEDNKFELIKEYVDHIFIENIYPVERLWWPGHFQSGSIPDSREPVKEIILADKNVKAKGYKKEGLDQRWLIIFAEGLGLNDVCFNVAPLKKEVIDEVENADYFTNIYIFNIFPSQSIIQVYPRYCVVFSESERAIYVKCLPISRQ